MGQLHPRIGALMRQAAGQAGRELPPKGRGWQEEKGEKSTHTRNIDHAARFATPAICAAMPATGPAGAASRPNRVS